MNPAFSPPEAVLYVMSRLFGHGHDAWLVGGCVRDLLLQRTPADWDVCTSAHPDAVLSLFPGSLDTGARHGTITALISCGSSPAHRLPVEITTWRSESGYTDHRHPDVVRFSDSLDTDLSRRDFTINAMAWHPEKGLVDLFGGREDLQRGLVRCVGDPLARFREDALRMLRAIRFCSQLGFQLDRDAMLAIRHHRDAISHVSRERIQYELNRTLTGICPSSASLWWETGLHSFLFSPAGLPDPADPGPLLASLDKRDDLRISDFPSPVRSWDDGLLSWTIFWIATGLGTRDEALEVWMRANRFPKHRALGIRKLLRLHGEHLPRTPRNLRYASLSEGTDWMECSLLLDALLSDPTAAPMELPAPVKPVLDGNMLKTLLDGQGAPNGRDFGALLSCLGMAVCERPDLNQAECLAQLVHIMLSAFPPVNPAGFPSNPPLTLKAANKESYDKTLQKSL